jgi:hypothetical protein
LPAIYRSLDAAIASDCGHKKDKDAPVITIYADNGGRENALLILR